MGTVASDQRFDAPLEELAGRSRRVINDAVGRQLSPGEFAWVDGKEDPTLPSEEATVGKNGLGGKTDVAIHPSGWRALGRGSRGPNRRTLGRIVGSRVESTAAAAEARRSGRVVNGAMEVLK